MKNKSSFPEDKISKNWKARNQFPIYFSTKNSWTENLDPESGLMTTKMPIFGNFTQQFFRKNQNEKIYANIYNAFL